MSENRIGKYVNYVDPVGLVHTGYIVAIEDGYYLVQSDNAAVPDAPWHFKIAAEFVELVITSPPDNDGS